jgi:hypothetical protein
MDITPIGIVINGCFQDLLGNRQGMVLVKFNVRGAFEFYLRRGRDNLGVEVARQTDECLHDALNINHHCLNCTSHDGQLLVQEVTRG